MPKTYDDTVNAIWGKMFDESASTSARMDGDISKIDYIRNGKVIATGSGKDCEEASRDLAQKLGIE
jgi:hypothetical protein